jgi:hypothetical protein
LADKEAAKAILYMELSKPPLVSELIKLVVEKTTPSRVTFENHKVLQAKLMTVKSLEELGVVLSELFSLDVNSILHYVSNVLHYLPGEYIDYFKILMETSELELLYSKLASKNLDEKPLRHVKLIDYSACTGIKQFSCIISKHSSRLKNACEKTGEDCERALAVSMLLSVFLYIKYLDNLRILKLEDDASLKEFIARNLGFLKGPGIIYFELGLARLLEAMKHRGDLVEMWCCGVMTLYDIAKNTLYYTNKLIDLITLFGIDRLFRYSLLRVLFSRWLRPW